MNIYNSLQEKLNPLKRKAHLLVASFLACNATFRHLTLIYFSWHLRSIYMRIKCSDSWGCTLPLIRSACNESRLLPSSSDYWPSQHSVSKCSNLEEVSLVSPGKQNEGTGAPLTWCVQTNTQAQTQHQHVGLTRGHTLIPTIGHRCLKHGAGNGSTSSSQVN